VIDWTLLPLYLALGAFVGFLAGLLGVGGGFTIVPVLMATFQHLGFGAAHLLTLAIATSSATIIFTAFSSARAHHKRGAVAWNIVWPMAPGLIIGSLIGPQIASALPMRVMAALVGSVTWFAGVRMLVNRPPRVPRVLPGRGALFGAGALIGLIGSMVGTAGAYLAVPFLAHRNVKIHAAVATSAAIGWPVAVTSTLSFVWAGLRQPDLPAHAIGYVYVPALIGVASASMLLAPLGARLAHAWPVARLRRAFALMLLVLGGYMWWKALAG
jgi:uncharacterized membrane protein YfcA